MGQAAIDLPDPLEKPALGSAPSADDLLAQLAGDEIDRLLAEADVEHPAEPEASAAGHSPPEPVAEAEPAPAPAAAQPQIEAQLDDLFKELSQHDAGQPAASAERAEAPAPPTPASDATPTPPKMAASVEQAPPPAPQATAPVEVETSSQERAELADVESVAVATDAAEDDDPLPAYLRPLEWLNAPLQSLPDAIRSAIGKVALITLFNALAILIYVLLFRHPQ